MTIIKKHKVIFSTIYLIISYLFFFICVNKLTLYLTYSNDLLFFFTIGNIWLLCNFICDLKKMYGFIYSKRYLIGLILFAILIIGKYNGSSVGLWTNYVQPKYEMKESTPILGVNRPIRSDEWLVSTPYALSQSNVEFSKTNNIINGKENLVTMYPKLPAKDISILTTPNNLGYLFLDKERAFSFSWYFTYFVLFFTSFELLMILTKKKKLYSLLGSILITLSPVIGWWQSPNIVAYGNLAMVLFYCFIINNNKKWKLLLSILFGYSGVLYIMCMYPAWQIPYGYCYLIILLWMVFENKDKVKINNLLYLIPVFVTILIIMIPIFIDNSKVLEIMNGTVYPGARFSTGGGHWKLLYSYFYDILFAFTSIDNPCEASQYISLYPLPTLYGIYIMIKNKKKDLFLILSSIVIVLLSIWVMFPLPEIFSRLSLIYMSTEVRAQVAIGFLSVLVLVYIMANYSSNEKIKLNKRIVIKVILALIFTISTALIGKEALNSMFPTYVRTIYVIIVIIFFVVIITLFLLSNTKSNFVFIIIMIFISNVATLLISPLNKGLDILYNKPFAKEIQNIIKEDKDAKFIVVNSGLVIPNYILVNGGSTINSTNFLPNLEFYHSLDKKNEYNHIYNRYAHLSVNLVDEETSFVLNQEDAISINLNYNDLCLTGATYLVTNNKDLNIYEKIYDEYDMKIYKTNCSN